MSSAQRRVKTATSSSKRSRNVKAEERFDPIELCRRLQLYQREQHNAHRRSHTRAEKRTVKEAYHHTPVLAAVDFARTATPELHREKDIHQLSRPVLRPCRIPDASLSPAEFVNQQEKARLRMEAAAERNQFQLTQELENALVSDKARDITRSQQRGFKGAFVAIGSQSRVTCELPTSPQDIAEARVVRDSLNRTLPQPNDRNDWAQRDECTGLGMGMVMPSIVSLGRYRTWEHRLSGSKGHGITHDPSNAAQAIDSKQLPHRASYIKLRSLFKRHRI